MARLASPCFCLFFLSFFFFRNNPSNNFYISLSYMRDSDDRYSPGATLSRNLSPHVTHVAISRPKPNAQMHVREILLWRALKHES